MEAVSISALARLTDILGETMKDVAPILVILIVFQGFVLRRRLPHPRRTMIGFAYVILGLALFLFGLEQALFPLGRLMASQLTAPSFIGEAKGWGAYRWVYVFAAAVGFATTIAEPALIAVGLKAEEISGRTISAWGLRLAVAFGVAIGVGLGAFRIVTGGELYLYVIGGYMAVMIQTIFAPRSIIPLAYDTGGVTTSTVTVPLVTALGLQLATTIPGRSAAMDGFGLIALASLFPMITVMGYAQAGAILSWWAARKRKNKGKS